VPCGRGREAAGGRSAATRTSDPAGRPARRAASDAEIAEMDAEIAEIDAEIAEMDAEIAEMDAEIAEMDAEIAEMDAEIAEMDAEMDARRVGRIRSESPGPPAGAPCAITVFAAAIAVIVRCNVRAAIAAIAGCNCGLPVGGATFNQHGIIS
jgi:Tfp pilus assembly protein FimV